MARREDVDNTIWDDEDFDALSDDAALLYIWSFTNPRCCMAGVYQVKARSIAEGRMTPARRTAAIEELTTGRFLFYIDNFLWVRSRVKHLRSRGPKIATSIIRDIKRIPSGHPIRLAFLAEYLSGHWISKWLADADFEDPSIPHAYPIDGVQGKGKGEETTTEETEKERLRAEWDDWLSHFHGITGRTSVTGSAEAKRFFAARRREGRTLAQLKQATVGCHSEEHLRSRGFNRPETILRDGNVERYIGLGEATTPGRIGDPALARILGRAA